MTRQDRIVTSNWDLYDTRHVVYRPALLSAEAVETGYWRACRDFYTWGSIFRGAWAKDDLVGKMRHIACAVGWKKLEPMWDLAIRAKRVTQLMPVLERVLSGFGKEA